MDAPVIKSYCAYVETLDKNNVHRLYHDKEYGFPLPNDNELFARLVLEINQAGLSWDTILKKKENFFKAYDDFEVAKVAKYNEKKIEKLLNNPGIIRNRLKINAAIENAKKILESSFPLRTIGDPEDISGAVCYLSSDDAKWITGTILTVDGGISAKQ